MGILRLFALVCLIGYPLVSFGQTSDRPSGSWLPRAGYDHDSTKNNKVVFEVVLSQEGKVISMKLIERPDTISAQSIQRLEEQVRKLDFELRHEPPPVETRGKVTFYFARE